MMKPPMKIELTISNKTAIFLLPSG